MIAVQGPYNVNNCLSYLGNCRVVWVLGLTLLIFCMYLLWHKLFFFY